MILTFGGSGGRDPIRDYTSGGFQVYLGGFQVAMGAIDVLRRQLAVELGPHGIRAVTLHSGGVPETTHEDWREAIIQSFIDASMLKRVETLDDAGNVAAFVASDLARTMTATAPRRLSTSLPAARSTRPSGEQGDAKRDLDHDKAEKP